MIDGIKCPISFFFGWLGRAMSVFEDDAPEILFSILCVLSGLVQSSEPALRVGGWAGENDPTPTSLFKGRNFRNLVKIRFKGVELTVGIRFTTSRSLSCTTDQVPRRAARYSTQGGRMPLSSAVLRQFWTTSTRCVFSNAAAKSCEKLD